MKILNARLFNFRNHNETTFDFAARMNVLVGDNGQGKTNALEALSFFCLTKSFYAGADSTVVQREKTLFEVEGTLESDSGKEYTVRVAYDDSQKKKKIQHQQYRSGKIFNGDRNVSRCHPFSGEQLHHLRFP